MSPVYSFFCRECDESFDKILLVSFSDAAQWCDECGSQLKREVEAPAKMVRGKGSWSSPA